MNKKVDLFYMIPILIELKKLKHMMRLKHKLQSVFQKLGCHLLMESYLIITIAGPSVANKKDQNNKELDTICGNKSIGNNVPINKLLEKSGLGKIKRPKNKPNNIT